MVKKQHIPKRAEMSEPRRVSWPRRRELDPELNTEQPPATAPRKGDLAWGDEGIDDPDQGSRR